MKNCVLNHTSSDKRAKWQRGGIRRVGNAYSIITDGILSRQDYNILFENISGKRFIPKETAESVNIYSDVSFSSDFFRFMDNSGISVNLFDKYGRYNGTFLPSDNKNSGKTLIKQAALYLDEGKRLETARGIELAALHNLRANLKYYGRRKEGRFSEAVDIFDDIFEDMKKAKDINNLMLKEAKARRLYYSMFNEIITDKAFAFTARTKRPPKDPINALISFGNVWLYSRVASEIAKTSLDMRIGILHATCDRGESLNLDIAEIFKPLIVDRSIFTLINKGMIDADRHFRKVDNEGIYLGFEGKRIFLQELESKLNLAQVSGGRSMTYLSRIKEEIGKINRLVAEGKE